MYQDYNRSIHKSSMHLSFCLNPHVIGFCIDLTGCTNRKLLVTNASRHEHLDSQEGGTSKIGIPSNLQTSIQPAESHQEELYP
jgi:hypothetical protein